MGVTIASVNVRFTLSDVMAEGALRKVLKDQPDLVALQEWGTDRNHILSRIAKEGDYAWARAPHGEPVMWRTDRYNFRACTPVRLARAEYVGHLPGRKSRLPQSVATEVCLDDLLAENDGAVVVVLDYHLTAEIQDVRGDGGYKKDLAHKLRVHRHKREKRRLGRRARAQQRRGRQVYAAGDSNYSHMQLGGFVNCWTDRNGGTLGGRPVDIVFADKKPMALKTVTTPSDHDALVCIYR
jgi:hypothetical protein